MKKETGKEPPPGWAVWRDLKPELESVVQAMGLPNKRAKQSESHRLVDLYVNRMLVVGEKKPLPSNCAIMEKPEDQDEDGNDEEAEEKDNGDAAGDAAACAAAAAQAAASEKKSVELETARRVANKQRGPKGNGAKRKGWEAAPAAGLGLKAIVKPKSSRQQRDVDVAAAAREEEEVHWDKARDREQGIRD